MAVAVESGREASPGLAASLLPTGTPHTGALGLLAVPVGDVTSEVGRLGGIDAVTEVPDGGGCPDSRRSIEDHCVPIMGERSKRRSCSGAVELPF